MWIWVWREVPKHNYTVAAKSLCVWGQARISAKNWKGFCTKQYNAGTERLAGGLHSQLRSKRNPSRPSHILHQEVERLSDLTCSQCQSVNQYCLRAIHSRTYGYVSAGTFVPTRQTRNWHLPWQGWHALPTENPLNESAALRVALKRINRSIPSVCLSQYSSEVNPNGNG
jgi:hypothetical protein